jgi:hypothetical protein
MPTYGYNENPWDQAPPWALELGYMMSRLLRNERRMENEMQLDFTKMVAAAARQQSVTNSVLQVLQDFNAKIKDISQQLADALAANDPVAAKAAQDQLDALAQGVDDNDTKIATAIDTPGTAPTPTPTPTPIEPVV